MRTVLLLMLCAILRGEAATVVFGWDTATNAESYYVTEQVGTNHVKLTNSHTTNLTCTVTNIVPGAHVFNVWASNMWGISPPSQSLLRPGVITNGVTNLTLKVSAVLQQSPYPQGPWLDMMILGDMPVLPTNGFIFYRVKLTATKG